MNPAGAFRFSRLPGVNYIGGRAYLIVAVQPVFAADKAEALDAGIELFPGHRVTVVLKEGEPGS
jgi:hypothetical protein